MNEENEGRSATTIMKKLPALLLIEWSNMGTSYEFSHFCSHSLAHLLIQCGLKTHNNYLWLHQ